LRTAQAAAQSPAQQQPVPQTFLLRKINKNKDSVFLRARTLAGKVSD
jgi:hypothetical protein